MKMKRNQARTWISEGLLAVDRRQADLARFMKLSPDKVTKIISGERGLSDDEAQLIRAFLKIPPPSLKEEKAKGGKSQTEAVGLVTEGLVGDRLDFPIYASAQGGPTGMMTSFDIIEWTKTPGPLLNVKGGFGMYVVGDSMEPAYKQGQLILCHPTKPPGRDDDILIVRRSEIDNEHSCLVKNYLGGDDERIRLRQWNPPPGQEREFWMDRAGIFKIFLIVGKYNNGR